MTHLFVVGQDADDHAGFGRIAVALDGVKVRFVAIVVDHQHLRLRNLKSGLNKVV